MKPWYVQKMHTPRDMVLENISPCQSATKCGFPAFWRIKMAAVSLYFVILHPFKGSKHASRSFF